MAGVQPFVFDISGGELCLDFANTVDLRGDPEHRADHLATFTDLAAWGRQTTIVTPAEERAMSRAAKRQPRRAVAVYERAIRLREAVYAIFSALARGDAVPAQALTVLTTELRAALSHIDLDPSSGGYRWAWRPDRDAMFEKPVWAVAKSAADLLTSSRAQAVRECAADTCWWLFLDTSRNRSRRWCDMKVCGNREKVRRFHQRAAGSRSRMQSKKREVRTSNF